VPTDVTAPAETATDTETAAEAVVEETTEG